jgi:hypothetical protein
MWLAGERRGREDKEKAREKMFSGFFSKAKRRGEDKI